MSSCFSVRSLCRHYIFWVIYVSDFLGSSAAVKTFSPSGPVFINSWHQAEPFVFTGAYLGSEPFLQKYYPSWGCWAFLEIWSLSSPSLFKLYFTGLKSAQWRILLSSRYRDSWLNMVSLLSIYVPADQIALFISPYWQAIMTTPWWIYTLWNWRGGLLYFKAILQGGLVTCFEGKTKVLFAAGLNQENEKCTPPHLEYI